MHSIEIRLFFIRNSLMRVGKSVQSFSYVTSLFSFIYGKATAFTQLYSRKNTETRRNAHANGRGPGYHTLPSEIGNVEVSLEDFDVALELATNYLPLLYQAVVISPSKTGIRSLILISLTCLIRKCA